MFVIFVIIFLFLLELASILLLYFVGAVAIIFQIAVIVFCIIFIIKCIKYINDNKYEIKNSKIMKMVISLSKFLLIIGIIVAIVAIIIMFFYNKAFTPTLEDYLGRYENDGGKWYYYDLTLKENNKCFFVDHSEDIEEYECSYTYNSDDTITISINNLKEYKSYDLRCEYNFKEEIDNDWEKDYLFCDTNLPRHSHYFKIQE